MISASNKNFKMSQIFYPKAATNIGMFIATKHKPTPNSHSQLTMSNTEEKTHILLTSCFNKRKMLAVSFAVN